ncbi:MAG: hypothetical protein EZS28_017182 [Streblomastix strix]|uniref:Uncharacterized protein n=1 Tax=Streblomastix strix TaxID=222440 RepID=A0A5J4VXC5_9EUKA|nr:MAG: hypothetical protein EZS28_017182 [Streblomastix strix]
MSSDEQLSLLLCDSSREKLHEQSIISSQQDGSVALSDLYQKQQVLGLNDQWLKSYMGQNNDLVEQKFRERSYEQQMAVFANYYKKPMESLDPTGERASEEYVGIDWNYWGEGLAGRI